MSSVPHLEPLRTLCLRHEEIQSWFGLILWGGSLHIHNLRQSHLPVFGRTRRQDTDRKCYGGKYLCIHVLPKLTGKNKIQICPLSLLQPGVALYTAYKARPASHSEAYAAAFTTAVAHSAFVRSGGKESSSAAMGWASNNAILNEFWPPYFHPSGTSTQAATPSYQ